MKISGTSKFSIIRHTGYSKSSDQGIQQVEISNKDSRLESNRFRDLIFEKKPKKEEKKEQSEEKNKPTKSDETDLYA